jgi:hypothetical protein
MTKQRSTRKRLFTRKLYLNLIKKLVTGCIWSIALCGAERGHFGKQIINTWKVLKYGAGEEWRR